jgi:hypothetical protein
MPLQDLGTEEAIVFFSPMIKNPLLLEPFKEQNFYDSPMSIAGLVDIAVPLPTRRKLFCWGIDSRESHLDI